MVLKQYIKTFVLKLQIKIKKFATKKVLLHFSIYSQPVTFTILDDK